MGFGGLFSDKDRRRHVDEQQPEVINIVQDTLTRIDDEVDNSYYDLVPESRQRFIDQLVVAAERYQRHFFHQQAFQETIARYWVACYRTFAELARIAGFDEVQDSPGQALTTGPASIVACLTGNLSYLVLAPATARRQRGSLSIDYRTFFLKEKPEVRGFTINHRGSVRIVIPPAINERLEVAYRTRAGKSLLRTSPLISIHRQSCPHPEGRTRLNRSMQEGNMYLHQYFEADISHWRESGGSARR